MENINTYCVTGNQEDLERYIIGTFGTEDFEVRLEAKDKIITVVKKNGWLTATAGEIRHGYATIESLAIDVINYYNDLVTGREDPWSELSKTVYNKAGEIGMLVRRRDGDRWNSYQDYSLCVNPEQADDVIPICKAVIDHVVASPDRHIEIYVRGYWNMNMLRDANEDIYGIIQMSREGDKIKISYGITISKACKETCCINDEKTTDPDDTFVLTMISDAFAALAKCDLSDFETKYNN